MTKAEKTARRGLLSLIGKLDAELYRRQLWLGRRRWERWVRKRQKAMGITP